MDRLHSLARGVRRAISESRMEEAVARLENAALMGVRVDPELLEQLPAERLEASALLRKARCEELIGRGELTAARDELSALLPELAASTLRGPLLSALAMLAELHLRTGRLEEAKPILRFLSDEWEQAEEEIGGDVPAALAKGFELLEKPPAERDRDGFERAAVEAYDRDGNGERGAAELFGQLARGVHRLSDAEWEERMTACGQRRRRGELGGSCLPYLRAARAFCRGMAQEAADELGKCDDATLPYPYSWKARLLRGRIAAVFAAAADEPAAGQAVPPGPGPEATADLALQFAHACLRFDQAAARGDWAAASMAGAQARAIARLGPVDAAAYELERMAAAEQTTAAREPQEPHTADGAAELEPWRACLFGRFDFERAGMTVAGIHWKRSKAKELMLYLLLQPGYAARREQAAEALFPGDDPRKIDNQFYVAAHRLKQVLHDNLGAEDGLIVKEGTVRLREGLIDYADVERYMALVRVGDQLWPTDRELAASMYEQAVPLYGEIAPGVLYADWLDRMRNETLARQREALRRLGSAARAGGEYERAEAWSREWIRLEPLQEEAYQLLLHALAEQGKTAEARTWFRQLEAALAEEPGTEPLPETRRLLRR